MKKAKVCLVLALTGGLVLAASAVPVTKALAFGDSITSGEETSGGQNTAYPRYLQTMYNNTITFVNVGVGGEHVKQGLQRIGSQLDYHRPNLLCLMEGIVDIVWKSSSFRYIEDHLTAMAQQALNRGIPVVIATLTPSVDATINRKIADFNANHIFKIGQALRIPVADTYSAIVSQPNWQTTLMNPAGDPGRVHPNASGENVMAQAFKVAIDQLIADLWFWATDLGGGWMWSDWFGYFFDSATGWLHHTEQGWLYTTGNDTANLWLYSAGLGWVWVRDSLYPYMYRAQDGTWLWYLRGTTAPRWFLNLNTGSWESHF